MFATTEDIHSTFLTTFLRRIPIPVSLPDLQHRSREEKEALTLQFSGGGAHACRPAATNAATVAGPDAVCLSGQRRRAEECGEIRRGVSWAVSGSRNADRDAARSAGKCRWRAALSEAMGQQEPLLIEPQTSWSGCCAARPSTGLIYDVQCRVLAQYEAVLNKNGLGRGARAWGRD